MAQNPAHPRLGLCAWSLRPDSPDDLLAALDRLGVRAVQFPLGWLIEKPEVWRGSIDKLRDGGITVASGMIGTRGEDYSTLQTIMRTGGVVPDEHWDHNRRIITDAADLARQRGIDTISFHAGFIPPGHDTPQALQLVDRLRTAARVLAERDIALLLETGQETADHLDAFLDHLGEPNVGVNFDPANMILYGKGDPVAALRKLLPRVRQVHIKDATTSDAPGETWGDEVPLGAGEVDWASFVKVLRDGGYDGYYLIEREAGASREADIRRAVEVVNPLLG